MSDPFNFRRIALGMTGAVEGAHMKHPDFRVKGKIFATLHADDVWGVVKLTPEQQARLVGEHPATFLPESGAWGRQGYTRVRLESADEETLGEALTLAWQNVARAASSKPGTKPKPKPKTTSRRVTRRGPG
jgi:hypothetical protein